MPRERLQKILARAGVASRRAAEELIRAGRVALDGRVVRELGTLADPETSRIDVDGRRIRLEPAAYLVLHKPRGVVSTMSDPSGRPTVAELVRGVGRRVVPVGRLDYQTSGVLLMTNDGAFAKQLLHPSSEVDKQYLLKLKGPVDATGLARLRESIEIDGKRTRPARVEPFKQEGDKSWFLVTLHEGKNRHVRRLAEHAGYRVMRLTRQTFAGITTEGLAPGQWRPLTNAELTQLRRKYGVPRV